MPKIRIFLPDFGLCLLCIYFFVELFHFYANLLILAMFYLSYVNPVGVFLPRTSLAHCFFIHFFYLLKFQASFVFSPVRRLDGRETTGRRAQLMPPVSPSE